MSAYVKFKQIAPRAQRPVKPGPAVKHATRGPTAPHRGFGGDEIVRREQITQLVQAVTARHAAMDRKGKP